MSNYESINRRPKSKAKLKVNLPAGPAKLNTNTFNILNGNKYINISK